MRKFLINVNGKSYEVEVEEVGGAPSASASFAPPAEAAAPAQAAPAQAAPSAPATGGKEGSIKVTSPMPGTILKINANVGDKVTKGQPVVILEAMKMENDIVAPEDGTIASINVTVGQSVNSGDIIATLA